MTCNLCNRLVEDLGHLKSATDEEWKQMLSQVLPDLQLAEEFIQPLVCEGCSNILQKLNLFLSRFKDTNNKIKAYSEHHNISVVDLKDLLLFETENKDILHAENNICRVCLCMVPIYDINPLDSNAIVEIYARDTSSYVNYEPVLNPVICVTCSATMDKLKEFRHNCAYTRNTLQLEYNQEYQNELSNVHSNEYIKPDSELENVEIFALDGIKIEDTSKQYLDLETKTTFESATEETCSENFNHYGYNEAVNSTNINSYANDQEFYGHEYIDNLRNTDTDDEDYSNDSENSNSNEDNTVLGNNFKITTSKGSDTIPRKKWARDPTKYQTITTEQNEVLLCCPYCDYKSKRRPYMRSHISITHEKDFIFYHCNLCPFKTKWKNALKLHHTGTHEKKLHHTGTHEKKFSIHECKSCDFKTKSAETLKKHTIVRHEANPVFFHCDLCDYKSKMKQSVRSHVKMHHESAINWFECKQCDFKTRWRTALKNHILVIHDDSVQLFKCDLCDYTSKMQNKIKRHTLLRHTTDCELLECDLCDYKAKSKAYLTRHAKSRHTSRDPSIFQCTLCEFKTELRHVLNQHVKAEHDKDGVVVRCDLCDFKTRWKSALKQHIKIKHDDSVELFACSHCFYKTKLKDNLRKHIILRHDTVVKFECKDCNYTTKTEDNLKRHVKFKHTKELQALKCIHCPYRTNWKAALHHHVKAKHPEVFYGAMPLFEDVASVIGEDIRKMYRDKLK